MIFLNPFPKNNRYVYKIIAIALWSPLNSKKSYSVLYINTFIQNTIPTMAFCNNVMRAMVNNRYALIHNAGSGIMIIIRKKIER